jgi:hypothetical protein
MLRLSDFIIASENGIYPSELIILFAINELVLSTSSNDVEVSRGILTQIARTNYTGTLSFFGEKTKELIDKGFIKEVESNGVKGLVTSEKFDELFGDRERWYREILENYPKFDDYQKPLKPTPSTANRVLVNHYYETIKGARTLHVKAMYYLKNNIQFLKDESITFEKFINNLNFK